MRLKPGDKVRDPKTGGTYTVEAVTFRIEPPITVEESDRMFFPEDLELVTDAEDVKRCPRCSVELPAGDLSALPHNEEGQPYCSGHCFQKDMESAGLTEEQRDARGDEEFRRSVNDCIKFLRNREEQHGEDWTPALHVLLGDVPSPLAKREEE